jgi:hypothetical protein
MFRLSTETGREVPDRDIAYVDRAADALASAEARGDRSR